MLAFQSLHDNKEIKKFYEQTQGKQLETTIYRMSESIFPFISNAAIFHLLQTEDIRCLPIVEIDKKIVQVGKYLTIEELSEITGLGISIQQKS